MTPPSLNMAFALKEQGNEYFKAGQYKEAESYYGQAISVRSNDPKLFQNRALTRIRLSDWPGAEQDSRKAIELDLSSMKAHYYLAQALLQMRHVQEAHQEGLRAYCMCIDTKDSSSEVVSQFVLRAKQAVWEVKEKERLRDLNSTLGSVEGLLEERLDADLKEAESRYLRKEIGEMGWGEEVAELRRDFETQRREVRSAFAHAEKPDTQERIVPDWMVDPITFEVMHDPVITPSGVSYERVALLKHLSNSGLDPLTRTKLSESMLVSNVGLKNACAEFLEKNGWAVDW